MTLLTANRSTAIVIDGREQLYFGGTNYLGLAHRKELLEAATQSFSTFGISSGAARLTSGETQPLVELERALAAFAGTQSALVVPSGFLANQVVVEALSDRVDAWAVQKDMHASIASALHHSGKPTHVYDTSSGANAESLAVQLGLPKSAALGVFVEPVEVRSGALVDLKALSKRLGPQDYLILDEAHSLGVLGERGGGALEHFDISPAERIVRTGTCSKALGTYGGFVLSTTTLIDVVKDRSLCFKGSTTLPPLLCAATLAALPLIPSALTQLRGNIEWLNAAFSSLPLSQFHPPVTPIYYFAPSQAMQNIRGALSRHDIFVPALGGYFNRSESGLRFTIQAGHTRHQLQRLLDAFSEGLRG